MIEKGEVVAQFLESYVKINPTGVDVAPKAVYRIPDNAEVFFHGKKRGFIIDGKFVALQDALQKVEPDGEFYRLTPGRYYVVFPKIRVPLEYTGFAYPRSTLNRLGVIKSQTAVFDPGYEGEWNQTFLFLSPARIHRGEAWVQVVFIRNSGTSGSYSGFWQGESYY